MAGGGPAYTEEELAQFRIEKNVKKAEKDEALFLELVKEGSADFLRAFLKKRPGAVEKEYVWEAGGTRYSGSLLCFAACHNSSKIVAMLVKDLGVAVNKRMDGPQNWSALHFASHNDAYEAAMELVKHGADAGNAFELASSEKMKTLLDPAYPERKALEALEKLRRESAAQLEGTWYSPQKKEIVHVYERPDLGLKLADIFNFETRHWQSVVRDIESGTMTQTITFFKDMPDHQVLHKALEKMKNLGQEIDPAEAGVIPGKTGFLKLPRPNP